MTRVFAMTSKTRTLSIVAVAVASIPVVYLSDESDELDSATLAVATTRGGSSPVQETLDVPESDAYPLHVLHELRVYVRYVVGEKNIAIERVELDPSTGEFVETVDVFGTSFEVNFVNSRTPEELYVYGTKRNGDDIIEQWTLAAPEGARTATRPISGTPIGTPVPNPAPLVAGIAGGDWIEPTQRLPLAEERREIYVGDDFGGVQYAACDPDGRFLMVFPSNVLTLYQVPIPDPDATALATPSAVYDEATVPELPYMGCIVPRNETQYGRMYVMTTGGSPLYPGTESSPTIDAQLAIFDVNNDGVFDGVVPQTYDEFEDAGYVWTEKFF